MNLILLCVLIHRIGFKPLPLVLYHFGPYPHPPPPPPLPVPIKPTHSNLAVYLIYNNNYFFNNHIRTCIVRIPSTCTCIMMRDMASHIGYTRNVQYIIVNKTLHRCYTHECILILRSAQLQMGFYVTRHHSEADRVKKIMHARLHDCARLSENVYRQFSLRILSIGVATCTQVPITVHAPTNIST